MADNQEGVKRKINSGGQVTKKLKLQMSSMQQQLDEQSKISKELADVLKALSPQLKDVVSNQSSPPEEKLTADNFDDLLVDQNGNIIKLNLF